MKNEVPHPITATRAPGSGRSASSAAARRQVVG